MSTATRTAPRTIGSEGPAPRRGATRPGATRGEATERRRPWLIIAVALAMAAALLISVARGAYRDGPLEPDAPSAGGSKAVVQVLGDLGVAVETRRHTADAADALREGGTVLVTDPRMLNAEQIIALDEARDEGDGRLVLVQPDFVVLSYITTGIFPSGALRSGAEVPAGPGCDDLAHGARILEVPDAEDALRGPATLYTTSGSASSCFTADGGALVAEQDGVLVLGSADLLTNDGVGLADNSALVLNALSGASDADGREGTAAASGTGTEAEVLTWYVPSSTDPMGTSSQTLLGYLPGWAGPLAAWLLLVAAIALLALGRRPGPVVVEPLPVTVRPQEMVLGRARLMQRAEQRDAAAASLRAATATRLADRLGLRHESSLDGLLAALAPHVSADGTRLRALLGPSPVSTDQDLVRLAHDLDSLEKEIDR